jgi:hypothetical protein
MVGKLFQPGVVLPPPGKQSKIVHVPLGSAPRYVRRHGMPINPKNRRERKERMRALRAAVRVGMS